MHLLLFNAPVTPAAVLGCGLILFLALAAAWWRSGGLKEPAEDHLWAATLCLTLVVNSYAPIYDAVLVVIAAALVWRGEEGSQGLRGWLLLLYMSPWLTQTIAEYLHLQVFTLVLAGLGTGLLAISWRGATGVDPNAIQLSSKKVLHPGILNRS